MKQYRFWILFVIVMALIVWGLVWLAGKDKPINPEGILSKNISENDQTLGNQSAKAVLVEYSDYQCPACAEFHPIVKEIVQKNSDKLLFAYRHFPLSQHANARVASYASEAAGKQGKFWEMHDMIFEKQNDWSAKTNAGEIFAGYAAQLNLEMNKYSEDVKSDAIKKKIDDDYQSGVDSKVEGTPTFYLNGKKMQFNSYDEFKKAIEGAASNQ